MSGAVYWVPSRAFVATAFRLAACALLFQQTFYHLKHSPAIVQPKTWESFRSWTSLKPKAARDITLTTHLSLSQLSHLQAQCSVWPHSIAAVVYIPHDKYYIYSEVKSFHLMSVDRAMAVLDNFHRRAHAAGPCRLNLQVVTERVGNPNVSNPTALDAMLSRYPANVLRNIANKLASTMLVLPLDVDLLPSVPPSWRGDFEAYPELLQIISSEHAMVLPVLAPQVEGNVSWEGSLQAALSESTLWILCMPRSQLFFSYSFLPFF